MLKDNFKALANPARIDILVLLSKSGQTGKGKGSSKSGELSVFEIVEKIPLSPSTISHHLNTLKKAKLVNARKDKQWIYYSLNRQTLNEVLEFLKKL
jgi:ArsR family transcriptional regulator